MTINKAVWVTILCLALLGPVTLAEQAGSQTETLTVSSGGTLRVEVRRADIRVRTGASGTVEVDAVGLDSRDADQLEISQSGDTVRVEYQGRDGRFDILVPTSFNLDLHSQRGDIAVVGRLDGNVSVQTAGGDVSVEDIEGNIEVATAGGDISGGAIGGGASISTSGGDIEFAPIGGDVEVGTGGGDIEIDEIGGNLDAGSGAGDVVVGDVAGTATVGTGGGDVHVGSVGEAASLNTAGGDVELAGGQGRIEVVTAGGDLNLAALEGSLKAVTAGGDINAELTPDGGEGENSLTSAGGDVTLYLDAGVGVTVECVIQVPDWDDASRLHIRSEFSGLNVEHDSASRQIRGNIDINGGGTLITITTVDGDIDLKQKGQ